jgi:prepilin-type N-terminal cleavage/methylation domain-containing protein
MTRKSGKSRVGGFTLVELLVVIGIITILISITIPVVSHIRKAANGAATAAQIQALRGAIESYFQAFNAYPGPLADLDMFNNTPNQSPPLPQNLGPGGSPYQVTMAENLVLGLMGGLQGVNGKPPIFVPDLVGQGPMNLAVDANRNLIYPKRYSPFYDGRSQLSTATALGPWYSFGKDHSFDTNIPEIVDRFPSEPMPILYLRARKDAKGVMGDTNTPGGTELYQYDLRQIWSYTYDFQKSRAATIYGPTPQGLSSLGNMKDQGPGDSTASGFIATKPPWNALPYFKNTSLNQSTTPNANGTPRSKDGFILISAGPDRIYGTSDDITTFGSVVP